MRAINFAKLLPADIPPGERILWHGRPGWVSLARHAFRVDFVAAYFALMTLWNAGMAALETSWGEAAVSAIKTAGSGLAAVLLLGLLAWLSARTTLYVVTSRRVVMKVGIALPVFFNLPFSGIAAASLCVYRDGSGDIPLALGPGDRIAYLHLWPHARPLRLSRPEPALRCVAGAGRIADILGRALVAAANERGVQGVRASAAENDKAAAWRPGVVAAA